MRGCPPSCGYCRRARTSSRLSRGRCAALPAQATHGRAFMHARAMPGTPRDSPLPSCGSSRVGGAPPSMALPPASAGKCPALGTKRVRPGPQQGPDAMCAPLGAPAELRGRRQGGGGDPLRKRDLKRPCRPRPRTTMTNERTQRLVNLGSSVGEAGVRSTKHPKKRTKPPKRGIKSRMMTLSKTSVGLARQTAATGSDLDPPCGGPRSAAQLPGMTANALAPGPCYRSLGTAEAL
jgi:hypothetical protein